MDHLVYATPDLAATVADFAASTGLKPAPGGAHPGRGTRNELIGLGPGRYLEIVGPDPEQGIVPRLFGIDQLSAPRLVTWAIRPRDLDAAVAEARAAGFDPGDPEAMHRSSPEGERLDWRLTRVMAEPSGVVPFLIDWQQTPHPSTRGLPEADLVSFEAWAPEPLEIRRLLAAVGAELPISAGEAGLSAVLETPRGRIRLA